MDGDKIDNPRCVKKELCNHFKDCFVRPSCSRPCLQEDLTWVLLVDQVDILVFYITWEDIKRVG